MLPLSVSLELIDLTLEDAWTAEERDVATPCTPDLSKSDVTTADITSSHTDENCRLNSKKIAVELPSSTLTQPASHFEGFTPPAHETSEVRAVRSLLESLQPDAQNEEYIEFDLTSFSVYMDSSIFPNELRPLHHLKSRGVNCMYFDGVLQHGQTRFFVRRVPFGRLPIGNYGDSNHSVGDQIWILSKLNEKLGREIYYKLQSPAPEYRRLYTPFLWIADLAKHVLDYCEYRRHSQNQRAVLYDLKSQFNSWLLRHHESSMVFRKWHSAARTTDFSAPFIAGMDYIFDEAFSLDPDIPLWHLLWKQVKTLDHYQPNLSLQHKEPSDFHQTIVTPYVYGLFSHMIFGDLLKPKKACLRVEKAQIEFIKKTQSMSVQSDSIRSPVRRYTDTIALVATIKPGDVISTLPDDKATTNTPWKRGSSAHIKEECLWYGLVQKVHKRAYGKRSFDVLWLYQPIDTPCSVMKYPWPNELFLSDNCTCHPSISKVQGHEVLSTHEVEWFGTPTTSAEFFVRQTYVASDCRWISLSKEHFVCGNDAAVLQESKNQCAYQVGDSVLVETRNMHLETFIIEQFIESGSRQFALMRCLYRRKDVDAANCLVAPNELVYSGQCVQIAVTKIDRRCCVRAFLVGEEIPAPYNRNGTGDAFFITHQEITVNDITEYHPLKSTNLPLLRQGFNPNKNVKKLQGLDLFCGGGNFGRGIEEGGAVNMKWANDIWTGAIHTYMANTYPTDCTPLLGSIDELLCRALDADQQTVPRPGDVHFISGGSPCPGFSLLTIDKTTIHQRKNQSLVASFASFVELYRPLYGILENVPSMVNSSSFRHSCVFSQLVCALVGLGYQVSVLFLDAWSFGSAQSRSRVFLAFTAPGLRPPKTPEASYSHPSNTRLHKLGEMSCGRPFDSRKIVPTPFKFVNIRDVVGDLPDIQDGKADYCVGYPDHRLSKGYTPMIRKQMQCIPTHPYEMNFSKSWWGTPGLAPVMSLSDRQLFPEDGTERTKPRSKGWGRVNPNGLVGTITTVPMPADARIGRVCHWEQNRPITILEARRAQGFPDNEVLVGSTADQYKVIGNSVSRHVALALGLSFREAWLGNLLDAGADAVRSDESPVESSHLSTDVIKFTRDISTELLDGKGRLKRLSTAHIEISAKKVRCDD